MNATSINLYISKLEADNAKFKDRVESQHIKILRLEDEIYRLKQRLETVPEYDDHSETGSNSVPDYEFVSESESESESVSSLPKKARRMLPPHYDSESDSESETVTSLPEKVEYNNALYDALLQVAENEEDEYKRETFENAADAIHKLPFEVTNGSEVSSGPKKVAGIGKGIARMIDEFIATGKISRTASSRVVNKPLYDALLQVAANEEDVYKKKSFENAAVNIYKLPFEVTRGAELASGPKKVAGIGKSIARMIDEFIATGKIARAPATF